MLTVTVNGSERKLNIGCRTFINIDVLLKILETDKQQVTLNGKTIRRDEFDKTTVTGGDTLGFAF